MNAPHFHPYREQQKAEAAKRRDELAAIMENGSTLDAASKIMGISFQRAGQLWKRIRDDLGWQAK
jgi:molybdenum-dependent DNA-binding transcriptional regulator ModE